MQTLSARATSVRPVNSATTLKARWQQQCWEMAEAGLPFELRDIQTKHFIFCQWLRAEYHYTFTYKYANGDSVARFSPGGSLHLS